MDLSAICEYQLGEIQKVFEGPYKEYREQSQKWGLYTDPIPSPRPGAVSCPGRGVLLPSPQCRSHGLTILPQPPPPVHQQLAPAPWLQQFSGVA